MDIDEIVEKSIDYMFVDMKDAKYWQTLSDHEKMVDDTCRADYIVFIDFNWLIFQLECSDEDISLVEFEEKLYTFASKKTAGLHISDGDVFFARDLEKYLNDPRYKLIKKPGD